MFGRLPTLYRWRTVAVAFIVCTLSGLWLAGFTPIPVVPSLGALIGAAAGLTVAYALVHDFSHRPRPVPVHRR